MANPWEIFLASFKGVREAPAPEVPPSAAQPVTPAASTVGKGRKKAAPKAPAK